MNIRYLLTSLIVLHFISALSFSAPADTNSADSGKSEITVPVSVYILDDQRGALSSIRTNGQLAEVFDKANEIWSQAGIRFEVKYAGRIVVPSKILQELVNGNYKPFLEGMNHKFQISNASLINAFYASGVGLVNGAAVRDDMFFVADFPSVRPERVTAHEIGRLLGLGHAHSDAGMLMYSGTNGTVLTKDEIKTARSNAKLKLNTTYHRDSLR